MDRLPCDWMNSGACQGSNLEFVTDIPDPRCLALCHGCQVKLLCLSYAYAYNEYGIWGETTASDRNRKLKREGVTRTRMKARDTFAYYYKEWKNGH